MKSCPVCEFIYEDDQSLCDMDQMQLVALPPEQSAKLESATPAKKRDRRRFILLTLCGILCLVLFFQFYKGELAFELSSNIQPTVESIDSAGPPARSDVAPQPPASPLPSESPSPTADSPTKPAAKTAPAKTVADKSLAEEITAVKSAPPVSTDVRQPPTHTSPPPPTVAKERAKPAPREQKRESKVSSFLKKTGRVLKKPFQF